MGALIAVTLLSAPAKAVAPEIELQAGWFHGVSHYEIDPAAAELAARIGVVLSGHLTLSGRVAAVRGSSVSDAFAFRPQPGVRGWQALGEVRMHSSGPFQVHFAGAAGIAQLSSWQVDLAETQPLHGGSAFAWRASAGLRVAPQSWGGFGVSLEAAISGWNGLRAAEMPGPFQRPPEPVYWLSVLGGLVYRFGN
jgi:hypothetical protein